MSLRPDEVDVRILEENLLKTNTLVESMVASCQKISNSSYKAEITIEPISGMQRRMQVYETNLNNCLKVVDGIRDYAKVTAREEKIIRQGPEAVGLPAYVAAIQSVIRVNDEIEQRKLHSIPKVKEKAVDLARMGTSGLKENLATILKEESNPIDPVPILASGKPFPLMSPKNADKLNELMGIVARFSARQDNTYVDSRSRYLAMSLSPVASKVKPTVRTGKAPYDKQSNGIHIYAEALLKMLQAEHDNLRCAFPKDEARVKQYFTQLAQTPLQTYQAAGEEISNHVQRNISTDALLIFELIEGTVALKRGLEPLTNSAAPLDRLIQSSYNVSQGVFTEILKICEARVQQVMTLPSDNGVCDATVEVMSRIRRFAEYKDSAVLAISGMKYQQWIPQPRPAWMSTFSSAPAGYTTTKPQELLSAVFSDSIDAFYVTLEMKAKQLNPKKPSQVGFFLLTNLTLIERFVTKSEVYKVLGGQGRERLEKLRKRGLNLFLEGWKATASLLMDTTVVNSKGSLSSKDRELVKDKFKTFNADFEELVKNHKTYTITDPALKQLLAKEVAFICPLYHRYYDKHIGGDFSKNVDKYIKYDKAQFDRVLQELGD
ncbi:exocyst complex protein EXO70 [Yarrowia lipolytica]|jgi:exocyst complex protein 7|uniref:Exocyst complex protein EXO70 n=2 Tax=Yarrowia lipolytica TaxID=4952 RepID=EXO70_YARLI|nr:YALI0C11946p [Yarrowia lipolytica CLIB122]Q6CC70.1 RecName: Full=Exocyst complex protein EXO70 [Yarrowia lipolytica CLIB122]AOW02722.1 hypothetical protein YALI1_C16653g [Yarrowia lipolytica]KAB8282403.1 exocyst complex protein EXO70 [Yarrowia lipolytica]KAE8171695.1 exocyst complex protein EXO70 [Yarrowia lipolytica]KAJ8053360.1 exocyst complex protein EXO70 [Yarrowia lipolytica]QNP95799.1 Exocyst complex protein EXO70 [Yarrowia lipolytica]|eukprot:XP_501742.1 YALI0C11946p [Yarrowia lipolytica CLIB122]